MASLACMAGFLSPSPPSNNTLNIGSGTRADRLREGSLPSDQRTVERWFDTEAFAVPGTQQFGNAGRNILIRTRHEHNSTCSFLRPFHSAPTAGARLISEPRPST